MGVTGAGSVLVTSVAVVVLLVAVTVPPLAVMSPPRTVESPPVMVFSNAPANAPNAVPVQKSSGMIPQ